MEIPTFITEDATPCREATNGFERHNINHSSPSSINMWVDCPHAWLAQYLFNKRSEFGTAAKAGTLVEDAVTNVIARGFTLDAAVASAVEIYNTFAIFDQSEAAKKRGLAIPGMICLAVGELSQYGEPEFNEQGKQKKIELLCNGAGWVLPIHGYLDYDFPKHKLVVDLKTTMRMPSEMSPSHQRQGAVYKKATGRRVRFLYTTNKNIETYEVENEMETLGEIKAILNRQERFLSAGDPAFLKSIVPVVTGSFYNDKAITKELFGV